MKLQEARAFVMPWGEYKGQSVEKVSAADKGLLYLDWLRGQMEADARCRAFMAISVFLDDPIIAKEIAEAMARKEVK